MDLKTIKTPNIFEYIDYRLYFQDLFMALHTYDCVFSQRAFARMAESSSPNYLQLITGRKLNISAAAVASLSNALSFSEKERSYFETLVSFDHAKTHDEKDRHFRLLLKTREYRSIKKLEKCQYDFFSHWYIPVVKELAVHPLFTGDLQWIADRIIPQISVAKVKKSVETLENLNLISLNIDTNRYTTTESVVSTPAEVISLAVVQYHRDCIRLGSESIDTFGPALRDIRSVTLGVSEKGFTEIRERLEAFWKELLDFCETQKDVKRVIQVNLQAFPLTTELNGENDGQ
jgi:uncharacterized protein (TIGR02147 family)